MMRLLLANGQGEVLETWLVCPKEAGYCDEDCAAELHLDDVEALVGKLRLEERK